MRTSSFFLSTLKEAPADAEVTSQKLMLRAGMIKKHASGIYTWMPLGLRVLRKVEQIVRQEMNHAGALELLMPAVQSGELWQESGRWSHYGAELLRLQDRQQRDFVIGPTHEEVITDTVRREVKSYRQLPLNFYQIQTKFRDEIRPRFGVMRGREFIMKDAYSFHTNYTDLQREYNNMYATYTKIFTRLGLQFRAVAADTGSIGGTGSHEFHVIAAIGEDAIAYCPQSDYAANVELAEAVFPNTTRPSPSEQLTKLSTPNAKTCEQVAQLLDLPLSKQVKSLVVVSSDGGAERVYLLLLRADHQLNEIKLGKLTGLAGFRMASAEEIQQNIGCAPGSIGPVAIDTTRLSLIYDRSVVNMADFICGANEDGYHLRGVNFVRDLPAPSPQQIHDIRQVVDGDPSPDGQGNLAICRGIEVGHIFQLRTKYSKAMQCSFLNEKGQNEFMEMGCYGIGITRAVAAAIEQNHDASGIIFPTAIAPFKLALVPMNYHKSSIVKQTCDQLYQQLIAQGVDVLLDDREERAGVLFADMDLIGIPHRIVIGERGLKEQQLEYRARSSTETQMISLDTVLDFVKSL